KRQLLTLIFERVWLDGQHVAAVQPKPSFAPFFENQPPETAGKGMCTERERRASNPRLSPRIRKSKFGSRMPLSRPPCKAASDPALRFGRLGTDSWCRRSGHPEPAPVARQASADVDTVTWWCC